MLRRLLFVSLFAVVLSHAVGGKRRIGDAEFDARSGGVLGVACLSRGMYFAKKTGGFWPAP